MYFVHLSCSLFVFSTHFISSTLCWNLVHIYPALIQAANLQALEASEGDVEAAVERLICANLAPASIASVDPAVEYASQLQELM